jgi:nickel-dependent lactate racemase
MGTIEIKVPTLLWYGNSELELSFPSKWDINVYPMDGANNKPLGKEEIKYAFRNPINSKRIKNLAENRKEAVIIFDDISRPTKVSQFISPILGELNEGGISNDHIRFISANGLHGAMDRFDFVKKLGENVIEEYSAFNHNPFNNLTNLGKTSSGTPVEINNEVLNCDLKIGVGSIVPHGQSGFGGGAKIILPGVSSYNTIISNHKLPVKWGIIDDNQTLLDMEETARIAGFDIKIDAVLNGKAEPTGLFIGDVVDEFREGVKLAKKVYTTPISKGFDIVVANAYFKSNESPLTIRFIKKVIKKGGTAVIIANDPKGPVVHYLEGKFGKDCGAPFYRGLRKLDGIGKAIIFSPYKLKDPWYQLFDPEKQIWIKNWEEVIEELNNIYIDKAKVAVIPHGTVQIPRNVLK